MDIILKSAVNDTDTIRTLFREYEAFLGVDLCFQSFEEELRTLPGKYAEPKGRLYLALCDGEAAGCIALRPNGETACEMKRLFVREKYRGLGIGELLAKQLISDAKEIGYQTMRLDTLESLTSAVALYRKHGFEETDAYYDNPYEEVVYFELQLQ